MKALAERLAAIQRDLNAPKNQHNKFGGYNYRSCEDILQAVKPLLNGLIITIDDDITVAADRVYVKATATITDGEQSISTTAFAREAAAKKGIDDSQVTGSTSSYARKYALNGLLLIDDNRDADSHDNRSEGKGGQSAQRPAFDASKAIKAIESAADKDTVNRYMRAARDRGASEQQLQQVQDAAMQRLSDLGETA